MSFVSTLSIPLVQPVISSVVEGISGRNVRGTGREYMDNIWTFSSVSSFKQYRDY